MGIEPVITERDTHDGDHGVEKEHPELKPVDPEVPKIDGNRGDGEESGGDEEDARDPVDARKRNFVKHSG